MRGFDRRCVQQAPDHSNRDDPKLLGFGRPDTLILVSGHRLWAHYEILGKHSVVLREQLHCSCIDPFWGRTLHIRDSPTTKRSLAGVKAWLQAVYPPQVMPSAQMMSEVTSLASDFMMETVLAQIKLSISGQCDLHNVATVEKQALATGNTSTPPIAEVVFDALAEFAVEELKAMPGYDELSSAAKVEVARRRVLLLERLLEMEKAGEKLHSRACAKKRVLRACVISHPQLFRACPSDLRADTRLDEAWLEEGEDEDSPFASDAPDLASSVDTQTPTYATASDRTRQRFRRADTADTAHTMGFNTLHRSRASRSFRGTARPVLSAV
ncbi:unnamed protein product [Effrenium voratum]|nr:unnamed protein product [Effrenium voratum]